MLVANLMTQPGETRDYAASEHLRAIRDHTGGRHLFDTVVLNNRLISPALLRRYAAEGAAPVENDLDAVRALGIEPVLTPLAEEDHVARHNPQRLARLLLRLAEERRQALGKSR